MIAKYQVKLSPEQQSQLEDLIRKGVHSATKIKRAQILLAVDKAGWGWTDVQAAQAYHCHVETVHNLRRRFGERGLEGVLTRKTQERASRPVKLDGDGQAQLIRLACGQAPDGRCRWTLDLLGEKLVDLKVVESISNQTVMRALKKTNSSPICGSNG